MQRHEKFTISPNQAFGFKQSNFGDTDKIVEIMIRQLDTVS